VFERLCHLDEIEDPGSRGFTVEIPGKEALSLFVVRKGDVLRAYRNSCPHTGAPLEWVPHQFLDLGGAFIECAVHGALFDLVEGRCLRGPCVGEVLAPLELERRGEALFLRLPDQSGF